MLEDVDSIVLSLLEIILLLADLIVFSEHFFTNFFEDDYLAWVIERLAPLLKSTEHVFGNLATLVEDNWLEVKRIA